jgi:type IV pilus assembly protein PilQ
MSATLRPALALLLACVAVGEARPAENNLSLNFQNMDLRAALYALAQQGGRDMVISDAVKGQISLKLSDVPWERALEIIMQARGLEQRAIGKTLYISRREDWLTEDKQRFDSDEQRRKLKPTGLTSFPLRHRQADEIKKIIEEGRLLSPAGSVLIDTASNTLFVTDNADSLAKVGKVIEQTDHPVRQVLIEARIVEAADHFSRDLGNKLSFATYRPDAFIHARSGLASPGRDNSYAYTNGGLDVPGNNAFGSIAAMFIPGARNLISLELRAMQASGRGQVISSPRLLTADRAEASIEEGSEIPYTQFNSRGTPSTTFKKATLSLRIKPIIAPDDTSILIEVEISKDSPNYTQQNNGAPTVDTKKIRTHVQVENGGTVVLGGIYIEEQRHNTQTVPWLGDIPVIGKLFGSRQGSKSRRELLIFITPQIVS